jgi:Protein of unknown function (DUF2442)
VKVMPDVIRVKALTENYTLEIVFENGEQRVFDMRPYLKFPAFSLLMEDNFFAKAHVFNGTVAWNDEIDMSPDTLYYAKQPGRVGNVVLPTFWTK